MRRESAWQIALGTVQCVCSVIIDTRRNRVRLKPDGTRWRMGGEVKGKLAYWVVSQYSHTTSEHGVFSITTADALTSAASSRLNWRLRRFKWTRPLRRKTKSGFCACAIRFQTHSTCIRRLVKFGLLKRWLCRRFVWVCSCVVTVVSD